IEQTATQLAQTHDMRLKLNLEPVARQLATETEYHLFRIAQEAITNALKHAAGSVVDVSLKHTASELRLTIRDDGQGFAEPDSNLQNYNHYGLLGMRERARQIGAAFILQSTPTHGTTITVVLLCPPLPPGE